MTSRHVRRIATVIAVSLLVAVSLGAPVLAPYGPAEMDRPRYFHPPQTLHWIDASGRWHVRPFVYGTTLVDPGGFVYQDDVARLVPIRLFVRASRYSLLGLFPTDVHLFGFDAPGHVFLLGSDQFARDQLSRLIYGARVSIGVGLVGVGVSFSLALLLGGLAGYVGGLVDAVVMRTAELLMSIPALYLLVALRGALPPELPSAAAYVAIVAMLGLVGWGEMARVVRGLVLPIRRSDYVIAAEALGAGRLRILTRHILPNVLSLVVVTATMAVPAYILGEVALSFVGLGVQEPDASWGNMLAQARSLRALSAFPWLLYVPAVAILFTVAGFTALGDGLRERLDPRGRASNRQ